MIKATLSLFVLACWLDLSTQRDPFCPLERNENQCRARRNQYKCGAFLMSLAGQDEKLRWLGALPDMLHKPSVRQSRQLMKSMGNIHRKQFRVIPGFCNEILANLRCHNIMDKFTRISLDSCDHSMLNENADETLGNILCRRAQRFAPGQNFQSFVSIGFYHSACGGNWTETHRNGRHLRMEEELCCKFENGRSEYFRCDGSDFRKKCDEPDPNADAFDYYDEELNELDDDDDVDFPLDKPREIAVRRPQSGPTVIRTPIGSSAASSSSSDGDDQLIRSVVRAGEVSSLRSRIPRRLKPVGPLKLGAVTKTIHKVGAGSAKVQAARAKQERPRVRTYFVRNGQITRTEDS